MNTRPRVIDYVFIGLAGLCFLGALIFLIVRLPSLPDRIPTHFAANGEIDGWGAKGTAAALPVISFVMLALTVPICFFPKVWNNLDRVPPALLPRAIRITRTMLASMAFVAQAFFGYMTVCMTSCAPMHPAASRILPPLLFLPIVIGIVLLSRLKKKGK